MNGMQAKLHLIADKVGDYQGRSISFSGNGFSNMKFIASAVTKANFNQWIKTIQSGSNKLTIINFLVLAHPTLRCEKQHYANIEKNIYQKIIAIYMPKNLHFAKAMKSFVHF